MKSLPILHCTLAIFAVAVPVSAQETAPPVVENTQALSGSLSLEDSIRIALATQGGPGAAQLQASSARRHYIGARRLCAAGHGARRLRLSQQ